MSLSDLQRLLWALDGWCLALDPNWGHCDPVENGACGILTAFWIVG